LLATGIDTRLTEIDEPINYQVVNLVFGEPLVDRVGLVGCLLIVVRGAEISGVAGHFPDDL
jgi:hypothetical protein